MQLLRVDDCYRLVPEHVARTKVGIRNRWSRAVDMTTSHKRSVAPDLLSGDVTEAD